ncbi:MAG: prevent-host-death protein [Hydrogenobaculum sp.]|nr:MAG: prevent-host-death protein [Hydrogenobaculum sp.]
MPNYTIDESKDEPIKLSDVIDIVKQQLQNLGDYVVISRDRYKELLEEEIELLYNQILKDIENGNYDTDIESHIKSLHE